MRLPLKNPKSGSNHIDTIVFDFDGTLADTLKSSLIAFESTLLQFHFELPKTLTKHIYGAFSIEGMFRYLGISDSVLLSKMVFRYNELYREIAPRIACLFPDVRFTLNLLKDCGFGLAIATNELRENLDMLLAIFGIDQIFDTTCCADEVKRPKPWPDMGEKVLLQTGATSANTLMIGDSICDIAMAKQTGMKACAVGWGGIPLHRLIESSPDWAINEIRQLFHIVGTTQRVPDFNHALVKGTDRISETLLIR